MKNFIHPAKYRSNQRINFGQYKGIEIGTIFLYDPEYIEYLIREKSHFCIEDLNYLIENGVINTTVWVDKFKVMIMQKENMQKYPFYIKHLDMFKSFLREFEMDQDVFKKNEENLRFDGTLMLNIKGTIENGKLKRFED